jgi:ribosomal protein S27E
MSDDIDIDLDEEEEEEKRKRRGVVKAFKEKPVSTPVEEDETITVSSSDVKKLIETAPSAQQRKAYEYMWDLLKRLDRIRKQQTQITDVGEIGFPEEPFKTSIFKKASRMMEDAIAFAIYMKMMQQMGLTNLIGSPVPEDRTAKELLDRIAKLEDAIRKKEEESRYEAIRKEIEELKKTFFEKLESMKPKEESELVRRLESLESTMKDKKFEEAIEKLMERLTPQNQKSVAEDLINRLINTTTELQKEVAQARSDALKVEIESLKERLEEVKAAAQSDPIESLKRSLDLWSDMASKIRAAVTGEKPDIKERIAEKASDAVPDILNTLLRIVETKATSPSNPNEMLVECPKCKHRFTIDKNQEWVICPSCGARLRNKYAPSAQQIEQTPIQEEKPEEGTE